MASRPADYHDHHDDFQEEGTRVTPARLRAQVHKLLESTDIKITEFQKIIGVNANSYGKFMHGKYKDAWSATQNGTYWAAAYFFYREKRLGGRAMGKERAYGAGGAAVATPAGPSAGGAAKPSAKTPLPDVSAISTDGTVYQTPAEVRKELRTTLTKYDASVAALARAATVPYQSFNNFMKATGEFGGRDNQGARRRRRPLVRRLHTRPRGRQSDGCAVRACVPSHPQPINRRRSLSSGCASRRARRSRRSARRSRLRSLTASSTGAPAVPSSASTRMASTGSRRACHSTLRRMRSAAT